jgi:hypothetical protein
MLETANPWRVSLELKMQYKTIWMINKKRLIAAAKAGA